MFKRKILLTILSFTALFSLVFTFIGQINVVAEDTYIVEGGRHTIDFSDPDHINEFLLFTEFDKTMWILDEKLFAYALCEQKAILKGKLFTDVDVSVDISTLNKNGKFDSGIYIGAKNIGPQMDQINGWNVNVEHGAGQKTYYLKLHRFINGVWDGIRVEISGIPYTSDTVNLRVVVKGQMLYAFLNKNKEPTITYNIGSTSEGYVGLRNYYSPNTFDNFSVIGNCIEVNRDELDEKVLLATELLELNLTPASTERLNQALELANTATTQNEVDIALNMIKKAIKEAENFNNFAALTNLINEVKLIENPNYSVYTNNSWNSLLAVLNICEQLTEHSDEEIVSYWYNRLAARKQGLIRYFGGGAS